MMSGARIATGLIVMLAVAGIAVGCGGDDGDGGDTSADLNLVQDGTLMIGVPRIPPKYANDFFQSFELEMAEEIAKRLGLTPKVVDTPSRSIYQDLTRGKFDIVAYTAEVGTELGTADRVVISNAYLEGLDQKEYGFPVRSVLAELDPGETTTQEFEVGEGEITGGDEPLLDAVNAQLDAIIADGTYESIFEKWFKRKPPDQFRPSA